MLIRTILFILACFPIAQASEYWQQKVHYDIDVTLVDSVHQIYGHEQLTYINNSPDNLDYIWMHLWPNAYKHKETALARQKFNQFSTKMHFLPDSSFGWIEIENVKASGKKIYWEYRAADTIDVAKFYLNAPLASGDTLIFDLDFTVKVPNVLSRLGHFGHHYEMTQWYPKPAVYDMQGWHPMSYLDMGEFYGEWGDFEVSITLPQNYSVAATGVLQDSLEIAWRDSLAQQGNAFLDSMSMEDKPDIVTLEYLSQARPASAKRNKTITFKQSDVHDFAWFADKRFVVTNDSLILPSGRVMQAWTYSLPDNLENYRWSNDYIKDAVSFYSKSFMEYPYEHTTVVDGDFSAGGGMEYPMITLINNIGIQPAMEQVIMHEVGHNWFYGLSASNEREHPWMDEGLNSYAENRYWKDKYPDDDMLSTSVEKPFWYPYLEYLTADLTKSSIEDWAYYIAALPKMDQAANLETEAYTDYNYGMMVYKKAAVVTETLHEYLGDSLMHAGWSEYFKRWSYKHPTPDNLRIVFEEVSGENLSWYFDDLLGSTGRIDYALQDYDCQPRGSAYETTVKLENKGMVSPPLPIGVYGNSEADKKITWVQPTGIHDVFQIKSDFPVKTVKLDPELYLLDVNRSNNDKLFDLRFNLMKLAINPEANHVVTTIPYLWYSSLNGVHPGVILTHKNFIPWGTDWYFRTYWGPTTKTAGYRLSLGRKLFPSSGREIQFHTRLAQDWYFDLAELSTTFRRRDPRMTDDEQKIRVSLMAQNFTDGQFIRDGDTTHYLDPLVWQVGRYLSLKVNLSRAKRRTLWSRNLEAQGSFAVKKDGHPYVKLQSFYNHRKRYSRKGSIRTTLFGRVAFGDVPSHERFFISTSMDPEMNNKFILSRSDSWAAPGHLATYPDEYSIPGYVSTEDSVVATSTLAIVGFKIRVDIPKFENLNLLTGLALAMDQSDAEDLLVGSLSPVWKAGPIQIIYTPIRLESNALVTDWSRFQVALDLSMAGSIRLGI